MRTCVLYGITHLPHGTATGTFPPLPQPMKAGTLFSDPEVYKVELT